MFFFIVGRDLGFNRYATQLSVYEKWYSFHAVDGHLLTPNTTNETLLAETCFRSGSAKTPWWSLDLGAEYDIYDILLYGRWDKLGEQAFSYRSVMHSTKQLKCVLESGLPIKELLVLSV